MGTQRRHPIPRRQADDQGEVSRDSRSCGVPCIGSPIEEAATAGHNKLHRFMPTLGNVLCLDDPELQSIGSWIEIPSGGGPAPAGKSRAIWLMGRHYAGGQTERSASVKVAILQRFWQLFNLKKGELAMTDKHLLPQGSWTWQELAVANDRLPPLEIAPGGSSGAIPVEDPAALAARECSRVRCGRCDPSGCGRTTARREFCQRCLARMPRGIYSAVAAQCGWLI